MIRLENVSKYYVSNNEVTLGLRRISLEFTVGELVAITGESGSGKSTLLNVLSGSDSYEEGELYINGEPTSYFDEENWEKYRRDYIGFIYQNYNLIDSYTVYDNIYAALLIKGDTDDNREKIMEYLNKVGLKEHAGKRATQLSSGQKQRLAIARALAKETKILVADEPTGNLDSANSAEIMAILNELAKDKLVFVVTHNFDEIESYATRKIRMYDGEVAEDITLQPKKLSSKVSTEEQESESEKVAEPGKGGDKKGKAAKIVALNRKSKPVSFAFMITFMTVTAAAFYILLGSFFSNLDNTTSKIFDNRHFTNGDISRIVVMKTDGSAFTEEEVEKLRNISRVETVDLYDCVSDTYYMLEQNVDWRYYFYYKSTRTDIPSFIRAQSMKQDKFMKTTSCITEDDLSAGKIGEGLYDIVLYSEDESVIGTTLFMYLGNKTLWGTDVAGITCTITGILKEETEQIYFSEKLGSMIQGNPMTYAQELIQSDEELLASAREIEEENNRSTWGYIVRGSMAGYDVEKPSILVADVKNEEEYENYVQAAGTLMITRPVFIVNEKLTGNEVIVSEEFLSASYVNPYFDIKEPRDLYSIMRMEIGDRSTGGAIYRDEGAGEKLFYVSMEAQEEITKSTSNVIEVSEALFRELAGYKESTQVAVYMEDYVYADDVLKDLKDEGYMAASVYRMGAVEYDMELVQRKAVSMGISLGAFLVLFLVAVFIVGMLMSLRMKDFNILKLLGMERVQLNRVNKRDIITNVILSSAVALVVIGILNFIRVEYIANIVKYYRILHYMIYAAVMAVFALLLDLRARARLKKRI